MAGLVEARQYMCLDADLLVLDSLAPLFEMHAKLPMGRVLIAPEAARSTICDLRRGLQMVYLATPAEVGSLFAAVPEAARETYVVNDGVFVADSEALATVDAILRGTPAITQWASSRRDVWWRQKAALNLALSRAQAIAPLDIMYNAQLHIEAAIRCPGEGRPRAQWRGRPARVIHFNGGAKNVYASWRHAVLAGSAAVPERGAPRDEAEVG
jgi:hypothetical protein